MKCCEAERNEGSCVMGGGGEWAHGCGSGVCESTQRSWENKREDLGGFLIVIMWVVVNRHTSGIVVVSDCAGGRAGGLGKVVNRFIKALWWFLIIKGSGESPLDF